jgi:hypothetical protein
MTSPCSVETDLTAHRARWLGQDGLVAGAAAAAHRAAAAVEHAQAASALRPGLLVAVKTAPTSAVSARYSSQLLVKMPPSLLLSE